jgi:hypothetical protein
MFLNLEQAINEWQKNPNSSVEIREFEGNYCLAIKRSADISIAGLTTNIPVVKLFQTIAQKSDEVLISSQGDVELFYQKCVDVEKELLYKLIGLINDFLETCHKKFI